MWKRRDLKTNCCIIAERIGKMFSGIFKLFWYNEWTCWNIWECINMFFYKYQNQGFNLTFNGGSVVLDVWHHMHKANLIK